MNEALIALCDLDDPGSAGFTLERDGERIAIFIVRRAEQAWGYVNNCPHAHVPLDWDNGRFLDLEGERIICSSHFARFDMATGACLGGPCRGQGLTPFPVEVRDGTVHAADSA